MLLMQLDRLSESNPPYLCSQSCDCYYARHGYVFVKSLIILLFSLLSLLSLHFLQQILLQLGKLSLRNDALFFE